MSQCSDKVSPTVFDSVLEYNPNYRVSTELRKLKEKNQKLFDEDINPPKEFERLICCHILQKDESSLDGHSVPSKRGSRLEDDEDDVLYMDGNSEIPAAAYSNRS